MMVGGEGERACTLTPPPPQAVSARQTRRPGSVAEAPPLDELEVVREGGDARIAVLTQLAVHIEDDAVLAADGAGIARVDHDVPPLPAAVGEAQIVARGAGLAEVHERHAGG